MAARKRLPGTYLPETVELFHTCRQNAGYDDNMDDRETFLTRSLKGELLTLEDYLAKLPLAEEEREEIASMVNHTQVEMAGLVVHLLLAELARFKKGQVRLDQIDYGDPDARSRRKDAALPHLRVTLDTWITANERATDASQRRYITNKGMEQRSGCMPQLVKTFMRDYAEKIRRHHQAMGWFTEGDGLSHNRKMGNAERVKGMQARKAARAEVRVLEDMHEIIQDEDLIVVEDEPHNEQSA